MANPPGMDTTFAPFVTAAGLIAERRCVLGPTPGDPLGILPLLGHKGELWQWHMEQAVATELDGLETRWYVACVDGRAVSNVMLTEHAGCGCLGHVFTLPKYRRRGLCQAIFEVMMPDFRARGGRRLLLGTGYDSAPYWIYHRNGFRPVVDGTGFMSYATDAFADWYAPRPAVPAALAWRHAGSLAPLLADDFGDGLQSLQLGAFGPCNWEWPSLRLLRDSLDRDDLHARVLETADGAGVGLAILARSGQWPRPLWLLDVVIHPCFVGSLGALIGSLPTVEGKLQAWLPAAAEARRAALVELGFDHEATLRGQLAGGGDVAILSRRD